jgi:predicted Zn finger-like uncharacterized protein
MHMEIQCKGCEGRYRVKPDMAGRMVRCKRCGMRFRVPYQARITTLEDEDSIDNAEVKADPQPAPTEQRTFEEYGAKPLTPLRKKRYEAPDPPLIPLPQDVTELWLPLLVSLLTYGIAAYLIIKNIAALPAPLSGFIIVLFLMIAFLALVFPMVIRTLEGACSTFEFDLPNSIKLQTTAALGLPVLGMTIGLFHGNIPGLLAGCGVGLALMLVLMLFMYQAPGLKGVEAGLLASVFFALWSGAGALAVFGLAWVLLPVWHLTMPWQEPPKPNVSIASATPDLSAAVAMQPAVAEPMVATAKSGAPSSIESTKSAAEPTTAPIVSAKEEPKWILAVDPPTAPVKLPVNLLYTVTMTGNIAVTPASGGAFVALMDDDSCDTYDLRTGRRIGSIKERFIPMPAMLSSGGKYLLARHTNHSRAGGSSYAASPGARASGGAELWSTTDGRLLSTINPAGVSGFRALNFAGNETLVTTAMSGSQRIIQVWDAASGQVIKTFDGEPGIASACSATGKFLVSVHENHLKIYDLTKASFVEDLGLPITVRICNGVAFHPDGTAVAAIVGESPQALRLIVGDLASGKIAQDWPISGPPSYESQRDLFWSPDASAILYAGSLIDRSTGKVFCRIPAQTYSGAVGHARGVLSTYHMLYEFTVPGTSGNSRVVYKSIMLDKPDLDNALASIRGAAFKPEDIAVALAPTTAPLGSTKPTSLAARASQKDWLFTVVMVRKTDIADIDKQIRELRSRLPELEQKASKAKEYADRLASAKEETGRDRNKNPIYRKTYNEREIGDAAVAASRAVDEKKKVNANVLRLEREKKEADIKRTVVGKLDDGTPVEVEAEGAAITAIADACDPDSRWRVTGGGRIAESTLHIKPRTLAPAP